MSVNSGGFSGEMGGFILHSATKLPVVSLDATSAAERVRLLARADDGLASHLALGHASVVLKIRTGLHRSIEEVVDGIFVLRKRVNQILASKNAEIVFQPVSEKPFKFQSATVDTQSSTARFLSAIADHSLATQILLDTATAGFSLYDSTHIRQNLSDTEQLLLEMELYNAFTQVVDELGAMNGGMKDFRGLTRQEMVERVSRVLMVRKFRNRGFDVTAGAFPPQFNNITHFRQWLLLQSIDHSLAGVDRDIVGGFLCRMDISPNRPVSLESRFGDASEDPNHVMKMASCAVEITQTVIEKCQS